MAKEFNDIKMWESIRHHLLFQGQIAFVELIDNALKDQGFKWDGEHIVPIQSDFKIEVGKWYVCTQSMMNNDIGKYEFVKNKIYYSPDGISLRSDFGWLCSIVENADIVLKCFRPATEEEIESFKQNGSQNPKFKDGDWVVCKGKTIRIKKADSLGFASDGVWVGAGTKEYQNARLWTIADAKDGDILHEESCTFIYKEQEEFGYHLVYCCLFDDGEFIDGGGLSFDTATTYPATKEQRDLLFAKMKDVGYEWNAENKKLKKLVEPKQETSDGELTEFEYLLKAIVNSYCQKVGQPTPDMMSNKGTKNHGEKLLALARKQFIEEACEWLTNHFYEYPYWLPDKENNKTIQVNIWEDFRKALEKGGKNE